ncbi:hypothetical protein GQX74_005600 [Glossina fuscipes]|nr:hypothetical protein GQX74_005600 [Glossina fuscipes]
MIQKDLTSTLQAPRVKLCVLTCLWAAHPIFCITVPDRLEVGGMLTLFSSLQSSLNWNKLLWRNYCTMNENFKSLRIGLAATLFLDNSMYDVQIDYSEFGGKTPIKEVIMIRTQDIMQILPSSPEWLP